MTALDDLRAALESAPDTNGGNTWRPEVGDSLIGTVRARDTAPSQYHAAVPRLLIETEEGATVYLYADHKVLRRLTDDLDPQAGDQIAVQRIETPPDKPYRNYKMIVRKTDDTGLPLS